MRRRNFVAGLGAAAMAAPAAAAKEPPAPARSERKPVYAALFAASGACVAAGNAALPRALAGKETAGVARSVSEATAACAALAGVAASGAPFALAFARTVGDLCRLCKSECDRFAAITELSAMSAACQACVDACVKA